MEEKVQSARAAEDEVDLFSFEGGIPEDPGNCRRDAPLAQLVEHLTLNQGVLGSSPRWCTTRWPVGQVAKTAASHAANRSSTLLPVTIIKKEVNAGNRGNDTVKASADDAQAPPVPIPNTEVKLSCAENTWLETTWEDR